MFAWSYPLLNVFLSVMWVFLWVLWIFLVVRVVIDIFRSHDLGGFGKAGWLVFVCLLPFLGVFVYLMARGGKMQERSIESAREQDQAFRAYVQTAAGGSADQLDKLADLRDRGIITQGEFDAEKAHLLTHNGTGAATPPYSRVG